MQALAATQANQLATRQALECSLGPISNLRENCSYLFNTYMHAIVEESRFGGSQNGRCLLVAYLFEVSKVASTLRSKSALSRNRRDVYL